jgi:hypothetical protein
MAKQQNLLGNRAKTPNHFALKYNRRSDVWNDLPVIIDIRLPIVWSNPAARMFGTSDEHIRAGLKKTWEMRPLALKKQYTSLLRAMSTLPRPSDRGYTVRPRSANGGMTYLRMGLMRRGTTKDEATSYHAMRSKIRAILSF